MLGKTNVQVRGTHYVTGPVTIYGEGLTVTPSAYDLDYFSSVTIPSNSTNYLRMLCEGTLTQVTEHEIGNLINIPDKVFSGRSSITYVELPPATKTMGNSAFAMLSNLQEIRISCPDLISLGVSAFERSLAPTVYINAPKLMICSYAFCDNSVLVSPNIVAIKVIDTYCFYNNSALREVTVPSCCTGINSYAFAMSSAAATYADLDIILLRHAIYDSSTNVISQAGTDFAQNVFTNRQAARVRIFAPMDSVAAYRYLVNRRFSAFTSRVHAYYDAQAGETLPTASSQQYSTYRSGTYSFTWYSDKALTNLVTQAAQAGRYYGVITVDQEV